MFLFQVGIDVENFPRCPYLLSRRVTLRLVMKLVIKKKKSNMVISEYFHRKNRPRQTS